MLVRHSLNQRLINRICQRSTGSLQKSVVQAATVEEALHKIARELEPHKSVLVTDPAAATRAARTLVKHYPNGVLYAVKANPDRDILRALWQGGIRRFDVCSLEEVEYVHKELPQAELCFMHPIKNKHTISEAWQEHGVTTFALDSLVELDKILTAVPAGTDHHAGLTLLVRIALPNRSALISLNSHAKYGADAETAVTILQRARERGVGRLGITFHVGSQCLDPEDYRQAAIQANEIVDSAQVPIQVIDFGGGLPVQYIDHQVPPLEVYLDLMKTTVQDLPQLQGCEIWLEPGRACVANAQHLIVHVEHRRDHYLYINNSMHHDLSDDARLNWRREVHLVRKALRTHREQPCMDQGEKFSFFGSTCDSEDYMAGPYTLPGDVKPGDAIWIKAVGAYGTIFGTGFGRAPHLALHESVQLALLPSLL